MSRRNNLLYFNRNKRGNLFVTSPEPQAVFNMLVAKKKRLEFWMPQEEDTAPQQPTDKTKVKAKGKGKAKTAKPNMQSAAKEALTKTIPTLDRAAAQAILRRSSLELKVLHRRHTSPYPVN